MSFSSPWLYIVLLGAVFVVYALLLPQRKQSATPTLGAVSDVEATLEQYMAAMEQDNDEIVQLLAELKQDTTSKQMTMQEQIAELRQRLASSEREVSSLDLRLQSMENERPQVHPMHQASQPVISEASVSLQQQEQAEEVQEEAISPSTLLVRQRYPELFELYDQGKSIDMIAKSTNMPKGEVQLILQLAKREESP